MISNKNNNNKNNKNNKQGSPKAAQGRPRGLLGPFPRPLVIQDYISQGLIFFPPSRGAVGRFKRNL